MSVEESWVEGSWVEDCGADVWVEDCGADAWDWASIQDRLNTIGMALELPDDKEDLAAELRSMADWIEEYGDENEA